MSELDFDALERRLNNHSLFWEDRNDYANDEILSLIWRLRQAEAERSSAIKREWLLRKYNAQLEQVREAARHYMDIPRDPRFLQGPEEFDLIAALAEYDRLTK